jgi:hypothetical protein
MRNWGCGRVSPDLTLYVRDLGLRSARSMFCINVSDWELAHSSEPNVHVRNGGLSEKSSRNGCVYEFLGAAFGRTVAAFVRNPRFNRRSLEPLSFL